jgi:hypothetical protein
MNKLNANKIKELKEKILKVWYTILSFIFININV